MNPLAAAPARLRIVGWIMLTTVLSTAAVVLTIRGALISETISAANADIEQEIDEFGRFAEEGRDPETNAPFASTERLLELHLLRQFPDEDEAMIGVARARESAGDNPVLVQANRRSLWLGRDRDLVQQIMQSTARSGVVQTVEGEMRWGRAQITTTGDDPGGAFIVGYNMAGAREAADATVRTISLVSLGGLLLTLAIGWLAAGRILAPVRLIRSAAAEITERDLTRRIPVRGNDDIAELTHTVNDMLGRLESAFLTQRQFVDDAGHELRTPITIVRGHLELMGSDPAEQRQTIHLVTDELDRMNRIVNDLLLLAKAERPDLVSVGPVDVADLTIELDAKVQGLADRRWILDRVADGTAQLDRQRVTQAVLQLAQRGAARPRLETRSGSARRSVTTPSPSGSPTAALASGPRRSARSSSVSPTAAPSAAPASGRGQGWASRSCVPSRRPTAASPTSPRLPVQAPTFGVLLPVGHGGPRGDEDGLDAPYTDDDHPADAVRGTSPPQQTAATGAPQ